MIRPGGNWGDQLIYHGAEWLAADLGIPWRTVSHDALARLSVGWGDVIYVHGSGGFNRYNSGMAAVCLEAALGVPGAVVIQGPCTVDEAEDLNSVAAALGNGRAEAVYFVAREERTRSLAAEVLAPRAQVLTSEDTALYVPPAWLWEQAGRPAQHMHLCGVRQDAERVSGLPEGPGGVVVDPAALADTFTHWVRIHAAARTIVTNRTHSAVCGALLGIPTTMFANGYHKNRSIWAFSLARRGVHWLDEFPAAGTTRSPLNWVPVRRVRQSWKVNRAILRLQGVPLA